jgi:hypothetical protein
VPTGTLANHLAIRKLAGERRRVIVQEVSHIYTDTGDSNQTLSNLTLLPLAAGQATFTWQRVGEVCRRTESGRVAAPVGAISIESPLRRLAGELFDHAEMTRICERARKQGMRLHLDGARLYIERDNFDLASVVDAMIRIVPVCGRCQLFRNSLTLRGEWAGERLDRCYSNRLGALARR